MNWNNPNMKWNNHSYKKLTGKRKIELIKELVYQKLINNKCNECGFNDWRVLQFDHINPDFKLFAISEALRHANGFKLIRVAMEIEKCQVLCPTCHYKKSMSNSNNWRFSYEQDTQSD